MRTRVLSVCFGLALACGAGLARGQDTIHWMVTGVPPKLIPDGPFRGTGYGEMQVAWLTAHLPQYRHRLEMVTPARLWHETQSRQDVCSLDIAQVPEREDWAVFSRRSTLAPGYRLLVRRDRLAVFSAFGDERGAVDLGRLGGDPGLTGLLVAGRHYMAAIDGFVEDPHRKAAVEMVSASTRIFEMIAGRRGDFAFASATEMNYFTALSAAAPEGRPSAPLALLPIKGGDSEVRGHLACSRGPFGAAVIRAANQLLDEPGNWDAFVAPERRWLNGKP